MRVTKIEDKERVLEILSNSFDANQSINYVVKHYKKRRQRVSRLMAYSFDLCMEFGEVFMSRDGLAGVLIMGQDNLRKLFLMISKSKL